MTRTRIEWCDWTWNPVWGCRGGCPYCYARAMARRFGLQVAGRDDFEPTWIEHNFARPFPRRPSRIFVNSMSDISDWEPEWLARVLERIDTAPAHIFLFLTKRPAAYYVFHGRPNLWLGATVTSENSLGMAQDALQFVRSRVRFLSIEPLQELIAPRFFDADGVDWIIVGAETGNRRERVRPLTAWIGDIYDFARRHKIPLFFKDSLRPYWPGELPQEFPHP